MMSLLTVLTRLAQRQSTSSCGVVYFYCFLSRAGRIRLLGELVPLCALVHSSGAPFAIF